MNSEDLAEALGNGTIYGAGLDVVTGEPHIGPDHPLVQAKNCELGPCDDAHLPGVVLPHMGSGDVDTRKAMASLCGSSASGSSMMLIGLRCAQRHCRG